MPSAAIITIGSSLLGSAAGGLVANAVGSAILGKVVGAAVSFGLNSLLAPGAEEQEGGAAEARVGRSIAVNPDNSAAAIPVIYGTVRVAPNRIFVSTDGTENRLLYIAFAICEGGHPLAPGTGMVERIDSFRFDNESYTRSKYTGRYSVETRLGADTQTAPALFTGGGNLPSNVWGTNHRCRGVAMMYWRLRMLDPELGEPEPWEGVPTITAEVLGRKVFDPRDATQSFTSPVTWRFSSNPALCILDYLTSERYGKGVPIGEIDQESFKDAANICDQPVVEPGGSNTVRFALNGVIDTSRSILSNIDVMLSQCRGTLIWAGGLYKLKIDVESPSATFAFTEDNIVGQWSISLGERAKRYNRVRVTYPDASHDYQPNTLIIDSPEMRAQDRTEILELAINYPLETNRHRARRLGTLALNSSRDQIAVQFTSTTAALAAEVGDLVSITHTTPGWAGKLFRLVSMELTGVDEINVSCVEYDESNFAGDVIDADDGTGDNTYLPNPLEVDPPGNPVATESLFETREGGGVKSRVTLTWEASGDAFLSHYEVEFRLSSDEEFTNLPLVPATFTTSVINDLAPASYVFRVRAVSAVGARSAYATTTTEILGLSAIPADVTGLSLSIAGGLVIARWDLHPDLDVRSGGSILFRHASAQTGATWGTSTSLGVSASGSSTFAVLPLKAGTYLAKAQDSTGQRSTNAASASTAQASVLAFTTLSTVQEDTAFSGTKTDTVAAGSPAVLKLDAGSDFDAVADVDAIVNWDAEGGILASGSYLFATGTDLTTVQSVRLTSLVQATVVVVNDLIDSRTALIDTWEDFDGNAGAEADAVVYYRQTDDDPAGSPAPTWSAWNRLDSAEVSARAFQYKAELTSADSDYNIEIAQLRVSVEQV